MGDLGKTNNVREWGYCDTENGVYFDLQGTELGVNIRSNTSGTVQVRRVAQAQWNKDKLDGTGVSGYNIDITKRNFYWIDFSWPSNPVRFGIYGLNGERIVCHILHNTNEGTSPITKIASLPLFFANYNIGVTGSSTEMRLQCGSVYSDSTTDYTYWRYADMETPTPKTIVTNVPILSIRPSLVVDDTTITNRVNAYPETLNVWVSGGEIKLQLFFGLEGVLVNPTWTLLGASSVEGDVGATSIGAHTETAMCTWYLSAGVHIIDLREYFETNDEAILLNADGVTQASVTFVGTRLSGTTVTTLLTMQYRELS
jgi:hypothetical protein